MEEEDFENLQDEYSENENDALEDSENGSSEDTDNRSEDAEIDPDTYILEKYGEELCALNAQFEKGEISLDVYNDLLIYNQMKISDEKIKLLNLTHSEKNSDYLVSEINSLFSELEKKKGQNKFDPNIIERTIDDIFRKYGEALEKELTEEEEFYFESNPITSGISGVINLPTPDKYQKQLQFFEQKIAKNDLSAEDVYSYLELRLDILINNLNQNLKHDIFYLRFQMDLQMEFANLKLEVEKEGMNIDIIKKLTESKLSDLVKKYETVQDSIFKKQDSKEVLKIIRQLTEIYVKNQYSKLERRFSDKEIIDDLKNKSLDFIIEKYAQYITSEYFDWATGGKKDEIYERPKYIKRTKLPILSGKETSLVKESEKREYLQRKEFENILSTLPKEILLKCADKFIIEGKINEPYSEYTPHEKYINELYAKSIPIWVFSRDYPEHIKNYAKEIDKMTDEFMIDKHIIKNMWNLGSKIEIGDIVYVDRTNSQIIKTMQQMDETRDQIDSNRISTTQQNNENINKLQHRLVQLELRLKSYNKYMRAPQYKGIVTKIYTESNMVDVKIDGSDKTISFPGTYITKYLKPVQENSLYTIANSDAFNTTTGIKETNTLPIAKWIKILLGVADFKLYDEALEKYKNLPISEKEIVNSRVMSGLSTSNIRQFTNGIPNKGPLIYKFPPKLPEIPENANENTESEYQDFKDYIDNLKEYVDNLTPETNPFVKMGVQVTNKLISKIHEKAYPSLKIAIENTPVNGFFKLSSVSDFTGLVLNLMSDQDRKTLQKILLTDEQIKEFTDVFFMTQDDGGVGGGNNQTTNFKPSFGPKLALVNKLKTITDHGEYSDLVTKIDKSIKITKIVGEEIFVEGRSKPVTKNILEKMLEQNHQVENISVSKKKNPVLDSIEWGLSFDPTFQLLDLSKKLVDSFIVHTEPKYRIKIIRSSGHFYSGWSINPIGDFSYGILTHVYKYPLIVTDFTEYLKLHRNNLFIRYENFRKLDILSHEEFASGNYLLRNIQYITQYLKDIKIEDDFKVELIIQQDIHQKIRQEQRKDILESLKFMYNDIVDLGTLQKFADEIELTVYNSFKDIYNGHFDNLDEINYGLIMKIRKSGFPSKHVKNILYNGNRGNGNDYRAYLYKISIAIFNIYNTNNFVQDYVKGDISLESIINRDLTQEEIEDGENNTENLINWSPPTEILNIMRNSHPEAYGIILDALDGVTDIIDISVIDKFEHKIGEKLSFLYRKLALIELIKLKSWQKTLDELDKIDESRQLKFLMKKRNQLRQINNITAKTRFIFFNELINKINKYSNSISKEYVEEYAENIENACYILTTNFNEYEQLSENILGSKINMSKLISEFIKGNQGPVDIIINIAELYSNYGKTQDGIKLLNNAKSGNWDSIKDLPTELLIGIKKASLSMTEAKERKKNGDKLIAENPELGIQEFKIVKNSEGDFIVKKIDKPIEIDEKKRTLDTMLNIIKFNYVPRINNMLGEEIQKIIDKNELTEQIVEEMNSRELVFPKDLLKLKSLTYPQLLDINSITYREPIFVDVVPMNMANEGVEVYPLKSRHGFLIGGKFPLEGRAYRYRDTDGKIKTKLSDICEWIGDKQKDIKYPSDMSVYFENDINQELEMLECVKKILNSAIFIKIRGEEVINSKEVLSKIIMAFGMREQIEESVIKYFNEFGGNRELFANGGTKEEYDSFLNNTLYTEAMQKLLGCPNLKKEKKKELINNSIPLDDTVSVSILKNGSQEIYRKLYKSKTELYPVPIRYDSDNYPVYSKSQKVRLAFLIEHGYLSPWYKNKIGITKTKNNVSFEGNLPFVIDESSSVWHESPYYVEQIFKDPMYGLPIVTRIGIYPKRIEGAEGHHIIKKIKFPENRYVVKEEPFKIKYFRSEISSQSQVNEFRLNEAQKPFRLDANDLIKKSGYAFIDPRMLAYSSKYEPDDVWSWDPMKDYKVGAQSDNNTWNNEKNRQIAILKDWLKKAGSTGSAFIAAKNEATRYLQMFRINLPSQKYNNFNQTRFKKPLKSSNEIALIKINKTWKKMTKEQLLNEAKRIGFYTAEMDKGTIKSKRSKNDRYKNSEKDKILSIMKTRLEAESKINATSIIGIIGVNEPEDGSLGGSVGGRVGGVSSDFAKSNDSIKRMYYIDNFIKNNLLNISPKVLELIKNPTKLFPHYNRYSITFDDEGNVDFVPKYERNKPCTDEMFYETVYEILKNMTHTTQFILDKNIITYVSDMSLFEKLGKDDKIKILTQFPIMKVIIKMKKNSIKITHWNILTTIYDMWYPVFNKGMSKEAIEKIKKNTLKYSFDKPVNILLIDVVNYLGDSYYQNSRYNKGIKYEQISNKYTGNITYLHKGYKFEKINSDEVSFVDKTSITSKYVHNPYITLLRNVDARDPKISIEMLVVGENLHSKVDVSSNMARRNALIYGVDPSNVDPYFNIPDPSHPASASKYREIIVKDEDIIKFLAKGGNYYTILEMPDAELKFRKLPTGDKMTVIKYYRIAVKEYFKSSDKKRLYTDLVQKKKLNPLTLNSYINKVNEADISPNQLSNYIDNLNILPDFLDINWPSRKKYIENELIEKIVNYFENHSEEKVINFMNNFFNEKRRDCHINITRPTKRLYM